jgi:hypothetical protein
MIRTHINAKSTYLVLLIILTGLVLFSTIPAAASTSPTVDSVGTNVSPQQTATIDITVTDSTGSVATDSVAVDIGSSDIPTDSVYETGDPAANFDADNSGTIDAGELNSAGTDFALGELSASGLNSIGTDFALS